MKKRTHPQHTTGMPQSPRTGEHCPVNGWWAPFNDEKNTHFITEGSLMPSINGSAVVWKLIVRRLRWEEQGPAHDLPPRGFALDTL
ncbi:hypothetical protein Q9R30_19220 [Arthrobacter sp. AB6]|uniref:hypothetical protein n=1 Tax=Micrococcaceae TaxID=1268 RepID=UPI0028816F0B|nr:hypothetical protein [Arthrobacter sp. AB6]MDT0197477.1 hypothetical protein [Arthrobacter sp. AB6]